MTNSLRTTAIDSVNYDQQPEDYNDGSVKYDQHPEDYSDWQC